MGDAGAIPAVLDGLVALEYRGYDSSGVGWLDGDNIQTTKSIGEVRRLIEKINADTSARVAIGHTRWATHGGVSEANCHPHLSHDNRVAVVHNGIITNHRELRAELESEGVVFSSQTDTEVIPNVLSKKQPIEKLRGSFAFLTITPDNPDSITGVRRGSQPLVAGRGEGFSFITSDVGAASLWSREIYAIEDGETVLVTRNGLEFWDGVKAIEKKPLVIKLKTKRASKGRFSTFMESEIHEIPEVIRRIKKQPQNPIKTSGTVHIAACGTSYHAGLFIANLLERSGIRTKTYIASEFVPSQPLIRDGDVGLVISQSGETADTLVALKHMKEAEMFTFGICNVEQSSIYRYVDHCVLTHAGVEVAVASTKAYIAQVITGMMLSGHPVDFDEVAFSIEEVLQNASDIKSLAKQYKDIKRIFFLGRGLDTITALESALKVKEITYKHCEGFAAGELKHGTLSLVDEHTLCVIFGDCEKLQSTRAEVEARGSQVWQIQNQHPLVNAVVAQLFALYLAQELGLDADKPRNLAKSVTVE